MKQYRCIRSYYFNMNDGNNDFKVFISLGQMFLVEDMTYLPENWYRHYDDCYEEIKND